MTLEISKEVNPVTGMRWWRVVDVDLPWHYWILSQHKSLAAAEKALAKHRSKEHDVEQPPPLGSPWNIRSDDGSNRHMPGVQPTVHGYYKRNGYESCPDCGAWLLGDEPPGATPAGSGRAEP